MLGGLHLGMSLSRARSRYFHDITLKSSLLSTYPQVNLYLNIEFNTVANGG
jgi:hypothetical protein